jgi:hypothetical protein
VADETVPEDDVAADEPVVHDQVAEDEVATRGLASAIYGLVVAGATLAAASTTNSVVRVAIGTIGTLLVYWTAESYAHVIARRTVVRRPLTRPEVRHLLAQGWGLVSASYIPLLGLVVAGLLGASTAIAVDVALIIVTVLLGIIGWTSSRRIDLTGWRLVANVLLTLALGFVMIGLKRLLH